MSAAISGRTYRGRKAANYERRRRGQGRWRGEHRAVADWLPPRGGIVLDVPCGTGRFFGLYASRGAEVIACDISEEMLALAATKIPRRAREQIQLTRCDVLDPAFAPGRVNVVVCVRLLHLVSQRECGRILRRLCGWSDAVILTVRLAPQYVENPSSTTMPERWFRDLVRKLGFAPTDERRLSRQGWTVMRLERRRR